MEHLKKYGAMYLVILAALATHQLLIAPHLAPKAKAKV